MEDTASNVKSLTVLALLRIAMGWLLFWAFLDKVFGFDFATKSESAWIAGGSPTTGFLKFGTHGPLSDFYQGLAGSLTIDWIFMIGLLLIGVALLLGIGVKLASFSGILMFLFMYTALIPPEHNPLIDEHIIYALILLVFLTQPVGDRLGLGKFWSSTKLVRRFPFLR